jgi:hypothetical protein
MSILPSWNKTAPTPISNTMQNKSQRLTRWSLMLQENNLIIKHIKCKGNAITDALSRVG